MRNRLRGSAAERQSATTFYLSLIALALSAVLVVALAERYL
jgi:hypothetical protein